jgi:ankyrin repeat protein
LKKLDRDCKWLLTVLVDKIPKGPGFKKFQPLLDDLLKHPKCRDFPTWKNTSHGETILHLAARTARTGHKALIQYICQNSDEWRKGIEEKSVTGLNCLHIAAQRDQPDPALMRLLLGLVGSSKATILDFNGNTPLHLAVDVRMCQQTGQRQVVEILLEASKDTIRTKNGKGLTPLRYHHETKAIPGFHLTAENTVANQIEALLKLNCLRLDIDRDETWEILYNDPTDRREFVFDLYGCEEIRADDLKHLTGHISLETVLKSVRIPDLTVHPPKGYPAARQEKRTDLENTNTGESNGTQVDSTKEQSLLDDCDELLSCLGRIDYCWIFKWLRSREVAKILRVSVEDRQQISHSDEAIEWCLKKTDVETLEWNRLDICSTAITNGAPRVRDLTLWCSGNNAVLKSWTSAGGLAELEDVSPSQARLSGFEESDDISNGMTFR